MPYLGCFLYGIPPSVGIDGLTRAGDFGSPADEAGIKCLSIAFLNGAVIL